MSDLLGQALLLQARQPRRESAQSRLAAQMLAGMNAPPNMGGPLDVLNRASAGIFGTLMAQRAEADARAREKQDLGAIIDQDAFQRQQRQEAMQGILNMAGLGGMTPAAPAAGGMGAMTPAGPQAQAPAAAGQEDALAASQARYNAVPGRPAEGAGFGRPELATPASNDPNDPARLWAQVNAMGPPLPPPSGRMNPNLGGAVAPVSPAAPAPAAGGQQNPAALERAAFAAMASGDPQLQPLGQMLVQMARREAPNLTSVSPGSALVDPRTGRVVAQIPERPDETERLFAAAGLRPGTPEYQQMARAIAERRGAPPTTNVNVDNRSESALLRADTDNLKDVTRGANEARQLLSLFDRAEAAIRRTPEGAGAQFAPIVGQLARSLGFNIEGTSEAEVLRSIQNQMASLQRLPGSGATSDRDMALFLQAVPRLGNTRDGNLALVDMGRRLMQRRIEEAGVFRRHIGQPDLQERLDALPPIFSEREREMLAGTPQAPAGAAQGLMQQTAPTGPSVQGPAPGMTASPPLPRPTSAEEMRRLPPGTRFIAPDGSLREVPR